MFQAPPLTHLIHNSENSTPHFANLQDQVKSSQIKNAFATLQLSASNGTSKNSKPESKLGAASRAKQQTCRSNLSVPYFQANQERPFRLVEAYSTRTLKTLKDPENPEIFKPSRLCMHTISTFFFWRPRRNRLPKSKRRRCCATQESGRMPKRWGNSGSFKVFRQSYCSCMKCVTVRPLAQTSSAAVGKRHCRRILRLRMRFYAQKACSEASSRRAHVGRRRRKLFENSTFTGPHGVKPHRHSHICGLTHFLGTGLVERHSFGAIRAFLSFRLEEKGTHWNPLLLWL